MHTMHGTISHRLTVSWTTLTVFELQVHTLSAQWITLNSEPDPAIVCMHRMIKATTELQSCMFIWPQWLNTLELINVCAKLVRHTMSCCRLPQKCQKLQGCSKALHCDLKSARFTLAQNHTACPLKNSQTSQATKHQPT